MMLNFLYLQITCSGGWVYAFPFLISATLFVVPRICVVAKPGKIKWHRTHLVVQAWLIFLISGYIRKKCRHIFLVCSCKFVITLKGKKKVRIWHIKEMLCYILMTKKKTYGKVLKCLHFLVWWSYEICMQKNLKLEETFCSYNLQQGALKIWIPMKYFGTEWFWSSTRLTQQWGNTPEFWSQGDSLVLLTCWARQGVVLWDGF